MINFATELQKDINKLVGVLLDNEELKQVLKRRLTKKEYKYYCMKIEKIDEKEMLKTLNCDTQRFEDIKKHTILKLNQEKIKKELVV